MILLTTLIQITAATGHILIRCLTHGLKQATPGRLSLGLHPAESSSVAIPLSEGHANYSSHSQLIVNILY